VANNLPAQLTSFVGRVAEMGEIRRILTDNRLVTLTGAGGAGKTRLALEVGTTLLTEFGDGVWYVDLGPITAPDVVPVTAARTLGLPDQQGRTTTDTLTRSIAERHMVIVLDNCEHLLDATAALIVTLLGACPSLVVLATSREPIGVTGEVTWRVPSLSLADEAIELFTDRARRARPDFTITDDNSAAAMEICRRLDGIPLAIELAAARVRALSLTEIVDSLHDRFRLLTGGARTAVRRQQTLRASVDWSHALLTEPERIVLRRLAVFVGGADLAAAQVVCGDGAVPPYQVLDQLVLLVDKSLVVAETTGGQTRFRMLETVRQYAQERLGESGEAGVLRTRHRDYYTAMAALLDTPATTGYERLIDQAETEIVNLRAAFGWSHESSDLDLASALASSLQPLWIARGRIREGLAWFDAVLAVDNTDHLEMAPVVRARALADKAVLAGSVLAVDCVDQAEHALAIARELDDPALLVRALTACGCIYGFNAAIAGPFLAEAIGLVRALGDGWRLSQILSWQAVGAVMAGDPVAAREAAEEGRDVADAIGNRSDSRRSRWCIGVARTFQGDLVGAVAQLRELSAEAEAAHDVLSRGAGLLNQGTALAYQGDTGAARAAARAAIADAAELGGFMEGYAHAALAVAELAAGDVSAAAAASDTARQQMGGLPGLGTANVGTMAEIALARGDLAAARRCADDAVQTTSGWYLASALATRARVAMAEGAPERAERDAHEALACAAGTGSHQPFPDILECLAGLAGAAESDQEAARLYGAADAIRRGSGAVRFKIYDAGFDASVAALRDAMGGENLERAWAEGAALSIDDAIAYARRGRGERKRPSIGWASLTPTERDVVRLLSEGLTNKGIATRLFVSPRTVQTHLTHVYTKLGLTSRVQLVQEAARHQ